MRKQILKTTGLVLLLALIGIQFIPTTLNNSSVAGHDDISTVVAVPSEVQQILSTSCNDCHSNQTIYPWYSKIQPVGFWLNHHVDEGKHKLNFSEFATYKLKRQLHKLDEVVEMIEEKEMPLASYTLIHNDAFLSAHQQLLLINWAKESKFRLQDTLTSIVSNDF